MTEAKAKYTYTESLDWIWYYANLYLDTPDRTAHYLMLVCQTIRQVFRRKPNEVKAEHFYRQWSKFDWESLFSTPGIEKSEEDKINEALLWRHNTKRRLDAMATGERPRKPKPNGIRNRT